MKSVIIPSTVQEIGYCAFGYDEELKPISDFVIYGVSSSMAHTYAKDVDQEYDYENDFEFISINEIDGETGKLRTKKDGAIEYAIDNDQVYIVGFDTLVADPVIPSEIEGLPVTRIYMGAFLQVLPKRL
jgi:histidinol phosphatase-like PHP family hydrolase